MRLERVVCLEWGDVSIVELHRRAGERRVRIAALTIQALAWSKRRHDFVRFVVRFEMRCDVRLLARVGCTNRIRSRFRGLKRLRDSECDVLTVVTNNIIFERRPAHLANDRKSWPGNRPKDL